MDIGDDPVAASATPLIPIEGPSGLAENGRRRKYYRITGQGRAELAGQRTQWQTVDAALRNIWATTPLPGGWTPAPARRRA